MIACKMCHVSCRGRCFVRFASSSDRGRKLPRYAHNKIPLYWIVSIEQRTVEVFSGPVGQGDLATYAGTPLTFHEGEAVPVELDGSVVGYLDVKEIFS
jgi:hypothetical protein